jgi:hypothetical protein
LIGAVEYQHGADGLRRATASLDDTVRLVQHLDGRRRGEAEASLQAARQELLPSQGDTRDRSRARADVRRVAPEPPRPRGARAVRSWYGSCPFP